LIIRERLHIIEDDPVNNEDRKAENEFAGSICKKIETKKDADQYQLVGFKTD
jgi:hypothetical protein